MIDILNKVVDTVYNAVITEYPNINVTTGYDPKNATFPCVVVEEIDNVPYRNTITDDCVENYSRLTYEVNVYTNSQDSAKSDGRKIIETIDAALAEELKFRRLRFNKPMNIGRTIFRQYIRSEVIVSKPEADGNNVVYRMYRR